MESADDLAMYFDPADFGVAVLIDSVSVNAIFDGGWAEWNGVPGARPALTCRSVDVDEVTRGAAVSVPGHGSFTVIEVRPDGSGISRIVLEKA